MLPVIAHRQLSAWMVLVASALLSSGWPKRIAAGLASAYMRAACTIFSAGTQVICATFSGGYSWTRSLQLVEAVRPFLDEFLVVEVLVDDDVEHAQRQRAVGARP